MASPFDIAEANLAGGSAVAENPFDVAEKSLSVSAAANPFDVAEQFLAPQPSVDELQKAGKIRLVAAPPTSPFVEGGSERLLKPIDQPVQANPLPVGSQTPLAPEILNRVARSGISAPSPQPIAGPIVQDILPETPTHEMLRRFGPEKLDEALNTSLWDYLPADMREAMTHDDFRSAMADKSDDKAAKIINGVVGGVGDTAKGFLSPVGIATLGIGSLTRTAQRLVSLAFATQMASGNPQIARDIGTEMGKPEDQRDYGKVARLMTAGGANTFLATLAGAHGLSPHGEPVAPVRSTDNTHEFFNQPVTQPEKISVAQSKPSANPFDVAEQKMDKPPAPFNPISEAQNQLRSEPKGTAAPGGETINTPVIGEQTPPAPTAEKAPTIAEKAAAAPSQPVTLADLAQLQAEMRGNQLKPSEPAKPSPPVPAEAAAPAALPGQSDFARYQELTSSLKGKSMDEAQPILSEIEAIKNRNGGVPPSENRPIGEKPNLSEPLANTPLSQPEVEATKNAPVAEPKATQQPGQSYVTGEKIASQSEASETGKQVPSTRGEDVLHAAVERKLIEALPELPTHVEMNVSKETAKAIDFIKSNPEEALRISQGEEGNSSVRPEAVYTAMEEKAVREGDAETLLKLSQSKLPTEAGQRLKLLDSKDPNSPVKIMRDIRETREAIGERRAKTTKTKVVNEIKSTMRRTRSSLMTWDQVVNKIICN